MTGNEALIAACAFAIGFSIARATRAHGDIRRLEAMETEVRALRSQIELVRAIALMTLDGELVDDGEGNLTRFDQCPEDAIETLQTLIWRARDLTFDHSKEPAT